MMIEKLRNAAIVAGLALAIPVTALYALKMECETCICNTNTGICTCQNCTITTD